MSLTERLLSFAVLILGWIFTRDRKSWAVIVDKRQRFEGNLLAITAYLAKQEGVQVNVINCGADDLQCEGSLGACVKVVRHHTFAELKVRLRSQQVVISHSLKPALGRYALLSDVRIINVWHGIPVKGMGNMDQSFPRSKLEAEFRRRKRIAFFCVSSELERSFIAACHLMDASQIHVVGIPRTDMLIHRDVMTIGQQNLFSDIAALKSGRKMILYAPTFRDGVVGATGLTRLDMVRLNGLLARHDVLLAVRPHPKEAASYDQLIDGLSHIVGADSRRWQDTNTVLLQADALVTDYSSVWLEYLLLRRPVAAYWWDFQAYAEQRGFLLDLESAFPGPRAFTATELEQCIAGWVVSGFTEDPEWTIKREQMRRLFHKHVDGRSCERIVERAMLD